MEMGDVIDHLSHSWGNFDLLQIGFLTLCFLHMGKWKPPHCRWEEGDEIFAPGLGKQEGCGTWERGGQEGLES